MSPGDNVTERMGRNESPRMCRWKSVVRSALPGTYQDVAAIMSIMRRAATGLWSLLLLVGVAAASAEQNPPASADAQKLETA